MEKEMKIIIAENQQYETLQIVHQKLSNSWQTLNKDNMPIAIKDFIQEFLINSFFYDTSKPDYNREMYNFILQGIQGCDYEVYDEFKELCKQYQSLLESYYKFRGEINVIVDVPLSLETQGNWLSFSVSYDNGIYTTKEVEYKKDTETLELKDFHMNFAVGEVVKMLQNERYQVSRIVTTSF